MLLFLVRLQVSILRYSLLVRHRGHIPEYLVRFRVSIQISRGRVEVKLTGLITQGCASDTSGSNPAPATTSSYRIVGDYTSLVRTRPQFDPGYLLKCPDGGMVDTLV